uniref:RNA helicase n=1 Tax=Rhabditophanes sp. KR3021 TaxID=114890 RepID=A0AC35TJ70_9BILA
MVVAVPEAMDLLDPTLIDVFKTKLGFTEFTPVQKAAIKHMLTNFDVIVQAPTGSGKTLAFALPVFHTIYKQIKSKEDTKGIGAIILLPTRELASQVASVFKHFCETVDVPMALLMRGKKLDETLFDKHSILIATAGKLKHFLQQQQEPKKLFKHVEILVIDEADRFADLEFKDSISALLASLPKQRRTSLFSATQATDMEEFLKYGLRNPLRITIKGKTETKTSTDEDNKVVKKESAVVGAPKELSNYFLTVPAEKKIVTLIKFLKTQKKSKILLFFASSYCVEYFYKILKKELPIERGLFQCHGHKKNSKDALLKKFKNSGPTILLTTDVLARGIDIEGIDWVIQYNIPKKSSWFIHRAGRTARNGKLGNAIVFLTPEESGYVNFMEVHEKIVLTEMEPEVVTDAESEEHRQKLVAMNSGDRDSLELSTNAFMSLVKASTSHDCQIVCKGRHLDLVGFANSYGLLRLPKMPELARRDLSGFKRPAVMCSEVKYKDEKREEERQKKLVIRGSETEKKYEERALRDSRKPERKVSYKVQQEREGRTKRKAAIAEWDELSNAQTALKRFKKGKISKEQADELI